MAPIPALVLALSGLLMVRTSAPSVAEQILADFRVVKSIPIAANPHGIAFSPDGTRVFVVSSAGQALTVLNSSTDTIEKTFPLTDTPLGIVLTPDGQHAAISHFGADRISRIDLRTGQIDKTLRVGGRPSLFAPTGDGRRAFVHTSMRAMTLNGVVCGIVPRTIGGPYAVLVAEQLWAAGAKVIVGITSAGSHLVEPDPSVDPGRRQGRPG